MDDYQSDIEAISRISAITNILEVVCRSTGLGFAAVARVTKHRWIACAVRDEINFGLKPGGELQVETTICDEIRETGKLVVIDQVSEDEVFCNHPTPKLYGFQSYISVPIFRKSGEFFGTLCAIDPRPARVNTPEIIGMFQLFAELIAFHLDAQEKLDVTEIELSEERETAMLREQFIAVLGHDLRNPLNAITGGAEVLLRMKLDPDATSVAATVKGSAARMSAMIENLMDFARGRLGGGIQLKLLEEPNFERILEHVVEEMRIAWPDREIHSSLNFSNFVVCDPTRITQMFSNLLANALQHGVPDSPVWLEAHSNERELEISVINLGEPIPKENIDRLFQPFARSPRAGSVESGVDRSREGLGLGLYIASEIARAHGGSLAVSSTREETRFTFKLPFVEVAAVVADDPVLKFPAISQ